MRLASHNSFTYAKPVGLLSKLLKFAGKCQNVDIKTQYTKYGVRMFDLRIFPVKDSFVIQHGFITFDSKDLYSILLWLDNAVILNMEEVYCRVILEQNKPNIGHQYNIDQNFKAICSNLQHIYPNIKFISGRRKYDWKVLYKFNHEEPTMTDLYSSTTNLFCKSWLRKVDDIWPWLYARLMNKRNLSKDYPTEFLMIDFVDIR